MPLTFADRVRDTTTTTGTGTVTLSGTAPTGYQNFSVIGNGNTTYYTINAGSQWEVGIGTYSSTGPTLSRDTVLESSNANALVNFSAGTKDVFVTYPSDKSVIQDASGNVGIGTSTPGAKLDVVGPGSVYVRARSTDTTGSTIGYVGAEFAGGSALQMRAGSGYTYLLSTGASDPLLIGTNSTERARILSTGEFGVNTSAPGTTFEVALSTTGLPGLRASRSGAASQYIQMDIGQGASARLFATGSNKAMFITNNNSNAGLGTTTDSTFIQVPGPTANTPITAMYLQSSNGFVGIGTTAPTSLLELYSASAANFTTFGDGPTNITAQRSSTDASGANLVLRKARGTTASRTAVASGDTMGTLFFSAYGGTNNRNIATIAGVVDTYASDTSIGSYLAFSTTPNGSVTPAERARISADGSMTLNVGGVSSTHQFNYNESGGEIQLIDSTGAGPILIDNINGLARFYKVGSGSMSIGTTSTGVLAFNTNSAERMRITSAGNVGIGTTSPSERLDTGTGNTRTQALVVSGDQHLIYSASATELGIRIGASGPYYGIGDVGGSSMRLNSASGGPLLLAVAGNEAVRVDGARNVSIGTTAGNSRLRVVAGANVNAPILGNVANYSAFFSNTDAGYGLGVGTNAADGHVWLQAQRSDSAVAYNLTMQEAGGSVGIGLASPASLLHVKRGSNAIEVYPAGTWATRVINATDASTEHGLLVGNRWAAAASTVFEAGSIYGGGTGSWYSYYKIDGSGQSIWSNAGTERMRLDTSGNVGIGTSSPAGRLDVLSTSAGGASFMRVANGSGAANSYAAISLDPGNNGFNTRDAQIRAINNGGNQISLTFLTSNADTPFEVMRLNNAGNVGIGTASPGVRLDVAGGAIRVGNTHSMQFRNAAGTGTAVFTLQSDDNFVVYNATGTPISSFTQGSTNIAVYGSNGSNRMQVDSINNITSWLVNGSERARINSSGQFLIGTTSGGRTVCINASDNWIRQVNPSRSWLIGCGTGTAYTIYDETAGTSRLSIDTAGNWFGSNAILLGGGVNNDNRIEVGQGRTGNNFAYVDLIGDTTYTDFGLRLLRGSSGPNTESQLYHRGTGPFSIGCIDAGLLSFATSGLERMRIGSNGGVAIGGTGTDATLHIQTSYGGYDRLTQIAPSVANKPAFNIMAAKNSGGSDLWWSWGVNTDNSWRINQGVGFGGNGITIESNGVTTFTGLIVGRNSASTDVNSANDTGSISIRGSTTTVAAMSFHRAGAFAINMGLGLDAVFRIGGWSASSNCFQMDSSGNLTMLGNVTAYSDARIKKDVETIGSALDLVSKMRGVRYTRIDSGKRGVGVIAQEMLEVLPEVVQQGVGDDDTLSVAYGNLVGVLIEAVKELTARVAELERK